MREADFDVQAGNVHTFRLNRFVATLNSALNQQGREDWRQIQASYMKGSLLLSRTNGSASYTRFLVVKPKEGLLFQEGSFSEDSKQPADSHTPRLITPPVLFSDWNYGNHPAQLTVNSDLFTVVADKRKGFNNNTETSGGPGHFLMPFLWKFAPRVFKSLFPPGHETETTGKSLDLYSKDEYYYCIYSWTSRAKVQPGFPILRCHPHLRQFYRVNEVSRVAAGRSVAAQSLFIHPEDIEDRVNNLEID